MSCYLPSQRLEQAGCFAWNWTQCRAIPSQGEPIGGVQDHGVQQLQMEQPFTLVNGVRLRPQERCALKAGDQIQLSSSLTLEGQIPAHAQPGNPLPQPPKAPAAEMPEPKPFNKTRTRIARGGS